MPASREGSLAISQPTTIFLHLVKKAARDIHDKKISAKEKLTKLEFTSGCGDVQNKFKSYLDQVGRTYPFLVLELILQQIQSTAVILDPNKMASW